MNIHFRYAGLDDYSRIGQFLDDHWAKGHIYVRDRALFDWTFRRRTHWSDETYSFAVAEAGSELVAILGGIPFTFNCLGKPLKGVWIVNYAVRPDHRRGPLALQLLSEFRKPPFEVVLASGLNPASIAIYKVLRGVVLPEMPRHFAVLPEASRRMTNLIQLAYPDWTLERAEAITSEFILTGSDAGSSVKHGSTLPTSWSEVDWPQIAPQMIGAARDSDYLTWRYVHHPRFDYRMVVVPEGRRSGLAIWRLETIQTETSGGRTPVDRLARLVEFIPASEQNGGELLSALFDEVRAANAIGVDFYGYHGPTRATLQQNGVRCITAHPDGALIPSRFQPLDTAGGGILNAMFVQHALPHCTLEANCPWYLTKSDSDQDRPN